MEDVCSKCGKAKEFSSMGSITQWISACNCDLRPALVESEGRHLCDVCGKRISSGRAGSLTQWVFGPNSCQCNRTIAVGSKEPGAASAQTDNTAADTREEYEAVIEIAISVDPALFPQERYKPLQKLGAGAAGAVFLCRDTYLGKKVAVKTLRWLTAEQLVAFQREARAMSALNHPHIINILDFGVAQSGAPYMVLDYFPGISLDRHLQEYGKLDWTMALKLNGKLAEALSYAHDHQIYHRDIKPSNVLIKQSESGEFSVRLIDFGVAELNREIESTKAAQASCLVGTPAYMSPELSGGHRYDVRSEVYSLGCLMFECLTGHLPFSGETAMETIARHANEEPCRVSQLVDQVPEAVDTLVSRCLMKNPADRFQSMDELKTAIDILVREPDETQVNEGAQPMYRKPGVGIGLFVALVSLMAVAITSGGALMHLNVKQAKPVKIEAPQRDYFDKVYPGLEHGAGVGYSDDHLFNGAKFRAVNLKSRDCIEASKEASDDDLKELAGKETNFLRLVQTRITGRGLHYLKDSHVRELELDFTPLSDEYMDQLNELPELRELAIRHTGISAAGLRRVKPTNHVKHLCFYGCSNFDREALTETITHFPMLSILRIGSTAVTGADFGLLKKVKKLSRLDAEGIPATSDQYAIVASIPSLTTARFDFSDMTDEGLMQFRKAKKLTFLSVLGCPKISEAAQLRLKKALPKLRLQSRNTFLRDPKDKTTMDDFMDIMVPSDAKNR